MNTKVEFIAWSNLERSEIHKIFDKGYGMFHHVVDNFSRFKAGSELSQLNLSSGESFKVSVELFNLIKYSLDIAKKTRGVFDPTIIDLLEAYGYTPKLSFEKLENRKRLEKEIKNILERRPSWKQIKLNEKEKTVQLQKGQRIDLGGLGKGYAIDLAYKKLLPLKNFLINAGGDIRVRGEDKDDKPWLIGLKDPKLGQLKTIRFKNKAVCSSGIYARKVKYFHHLINPQSGKPCSDIQTIFVVANNAEKADAWATALFLDSKNIIKHIKNEDLRVYTVNKKGKFTKFE